MDITVLVKEKKLAYSAKYLRDKDNALALNTDFLDLLRKTDKKELEF